MIADAAARFPEALRTEADKRFFHARLAAAAGIALGRVTHEQEPSSGGRRLVLTRRVASLAPDPADPKALFKPGPVRSLDRAAGVTLVTWTPSST